MKSGPPDIRPDLVTYSTLLQYYDKINDVDKMKELFNDLIGEGLVFNSLMNALPFNKLIAACIRPLLPLIPSPLLLLYPVLIMEYTVVKRNLFHEAIEVILPYPPFLVYSY